MDILEESRSLRRYTIFKAGVTNSAGNFLSIVGSWVIVPDFKVSFTFKVLVSLIALCSSLTFILGLTYRDTFEESKKVFYEKGYYTLTLIIGLCLGFLLVHQAEVFGLLSTPHLGTWVFVVASIESYASYLYHRPKLFFFAYACLHFPIGIWLLLKGGVVSYVLAGVTFSYLLMIMDRVKQLKMLSDRTINAIVDGHKQRDINEQSVRLANLGIMASGIAHEINNPLAIAEGMVHIAGARLKKDEISKEDLLAKLSKVSDNHERIKQIILRMKEFSFDESSRVLEDIRFHDIVLDDLGLLNEKLLSSKISLVSDRLDTSLSYPCKRAEMTQILLSFYRNSIDAINASENISEKIIEFFSEEDEEYIKISVADTGHGLGEGGEIFVPFYTTKSPGEGFGLGLSLAQYLANAYGGKIEGQRVDGRTIFTLYLPKIS